MPNEQFFRFIMVRTKLHFDEMMMIMSALNKMNML